MSTREIDEPAATRNTGAARPERQGWRVEGAPSGAGPRNGQGQRAPGGRRFWLVLVALLALNWFVVSQVSRQPERTSVPYTFFRAQVEARNVAEITSRADTIQGIFRRAVAYTPPESDAKARSVTRFETERPSFAEDRLLERLLAKDVTVNAHPPEEPRSLLLTVLLSFGPTLLFLGLLVWLWRRAGAGAGAGLGALGRSRAKRYQSSGERTTFADVAGIDEAEEELAEIVQFLKQPERYRRLGAAAPKGVLLMGPPGTGKTLLARALAGEADVPFFSISASEFVEMIVGVGASRVRDLFEQAAKHAPAIVFIDELDAIGRARGSGVSLGGHDEREQTLNQILTEMDGFDGSEGVIVLAATNRPEILDPALLRAGRFDRRIAINPPDRAGRRAILEVHTRRVPLDADVDLDDVAAATPGMVGADLKNLVNEAALTAVKRRSEHVQPADFTNALEKILLGAERRITISAEERERTAYHEAGHALLGMLLPGADPVRKVSIIPRGRALGVTLQSPDSDRYGYSASYLRGRIVGALGGRAAEQLVYGDATTGAESDLEQATAVARRMVGRWGMSDGVGLVSVLPPDGSETMLWPGVAGGVSERTRELVDAEVRRVVTESYERALDLLRSHRDQLDALAQALLERETLDEADAYLAAQLASPAPAIPTPA